MNFLHRVIPDIGPQFWALEESIRSEFLPCLFVAAGGGDDDSFAEDDDYVPA